MSAGGSESLSRRKGESGDFRKVGVTNPEIRNEGLPFIYLVPKDAIGVAVPGACPNRVWVRDYGGRFLPD